MGLPDLQRLVFISKAGFQAIPRGHLTLTWRRRARDRPAPERRRAGRVAQRKEIIVAGRAAWTGANHLTVFGQLKALAESWQPQHIVIDATGVGEGLWSLLDRAFPARVIPVKFTQREKSEIGWRFLSIIETGRFRDNTANSSQLSALSPASAGYPEISTGTMSSTVGWQASTWPAFGL